jgi:beta-lactamase regulating signal transducer with metallopeptidase domain
MIIAWMVFVLVVGRVLATATLCADRLAVTLHRPRRFVWLASLILVALWPAVAIAASYVGTAALARGWRFGVNGDAPHRLPMIGVQVPLGLIPMWVDRVVVVAWVVTSVVLLARLALFGNSTRRWRMTLPIAEVDGVRVRLSPNTGPAIIGAFAMDIVIPEWVVALDARSRAFVIAHERAHRDARDIVLLWFAAILTALMPWNILLWWQCRRLSLAIEMDCDRRVLREHQHPIEYARLLLECAQRSTGPSWSRFAAAFVESPTRLEYRIAAMSEARESPTVLRCVAHTGMAIGALTLALAIRAPMTSVAREKMDADVGASFVPFGAFHTSAKQ